MKIVFFGTPRFAAEVLEHLLASGVDVIAVVSRPDKPKGRSSSLIPTPVKEVALAAGLSVLQPEKVVAEELPDADLYVVVAYGEILKQSVLDKPAIGCVNLHASLLPKLRGAAPIQRAIIDGEKETGVTVMHMVRKMDAGGMIAKAVVPIEPNMTFGELEEKLCQTGKKLLLQVIQDQNFAEEPQDENLATFAPKIELEDCEIDWNLPADAIHNLVRGVNPYPTAWCYATVGGEKKRLKIIETRLVDRSGRPGEILQNDKNGFIVACGKRALCINICQLEGKRAMQAQDLMRGIPELRLWH